MLQLSLRCKVIDRGYCKWRGAWTNELDDILLVVRYIYTQIKMGC